MERNRSFFAALPALFAWIAIMVFSGCAKRFTESDFPYVAPMLDNALSGIAEGDYGKFSKDFSEDLKDSVNAESFPEIIAKIDGTLGNFRSKTFISAKKARAKGKNYVIAKYVAEFEKDDMATITIYITDNNGKRLIEGFAATPAGAGK
jgi:competence protein ComGF